jgi:hypothetical protein
MRVSPELAGGLDDGDWAADSMFYDPSCSSIVQPCRIAQKLSFVRQAVVSRSTIFEPERCGCAWVVGFLPFRFNFES